MSKVFKSLLIWGVILAVLIGSFVLVGCAPSGFHRGTEPPIVFTGDGERIEINLFTQFPQLNPDFVATARWFEFNYKIYYIVRVGFVWTIYRQEDSSVVIGELSNSYELFGGGQTRMPFLQDNFLFYHISRVHFRGFGLQDWTWWRREYTAFHFFRFNLNTGENEEIRLTQFVEALQTIDSNWVINPNYRGEK